MAETHAEPLIAEVRRLLTDVVGQQVIAGAEDREPLFEHRLLDSLNLVEIVTAFEARFGVTVAPEDLVPENFRSIADMARFVSAKQLNQ